MDTPEKVRENRLRRMAHRQGYILQKSRRRDPRAYGYGGYRVVNARTKSVVQGKDYSLDMDGVERWLTRER